MATDYVGLDVHLKHTPVYILDRDGKLRSTHCSYPL